MSLHTERAEFFAALRSHARDPDHDLRTLFASDPGRAGHYSFELDGLSCDLSRQPLTAALMQRASQMAQALDLRGAVDRLFDGAIVNPSEQRPALHPLLRAPAGTALAAGLRERHAAILATLQAMPHLAQSLAAQGIDTLVNLGIGGSDLGPRLAWEALRERAINGRRLRFVANVDGCALQRVLAELDPARTAFVLASKTFTTQETLMNAASARQWMTDQGLDLHDQAGRMVALTAKPETALAWGIRPDRLLTFDEGVGGRYSLWSAIGFPLVFAFGADAFEELLAGAHALDRHLLEAPWETNLPFALALVDLLQRIGHERQSHAVIAYDERLARLPEYLQQLEMESNGKGVDSTGAALQWPSSAVIWGGVGSTTQHAFFQALHQGTDTVPVSFVAALRADHGLPGHHEALFANLAGQMAALMRGRSVEQALAQDLRASNDPEAALRRARQRSFNGNRPSTLILLERLDPRRLGMLIALYEHKVYLLAQFLGINPFDQWGVELGKEICNALLPAISGAEPAADADTATLALIRRFRAAQSA